MKYLILLILITSNLTLAKAAKPMPPITINPIPQKEFKTAFPEKAWSDHALKIVEKSKLLGATVKESFCPNGMSAKNWVHLLASMSKFESNFKPQQTYKESFKNSKGEYVISTGLLQISYESARGYGFSGVTTNDLKDPLKNLEIGIKILEKWVLLDKVIASGSGSNSKGGARYWSVLRTSGKLSEVKKHLKPWCE